MNIYENHIKAQGYLDNNEICIELSYHKGKGYYVSVVPQKRENGLVSFALFDGIYQLILPCSRKSKSAEAKAINAVKLEEVNLISAVANKYHMTIG